MRRNVLLVVLSVSLAVPCFPALAQSRSRGKKKEQPRVLKEGDEVRVWLDPAETLRDPNLEKAGIIQSVAVVFPACQQDQTNHRLPGWLHDNETLKLYNQAGRIGDKAGIDKMLAEGRAIRLPVETRVLVLNRTTVDCRARIVEGEHAGRVVEAFIRYLH